VGHVATNEDIPVTPLYKRWIDECAKLMGGLDICALDAVHSKKTGKDYILVMQCDSIHTEITLLCCSSTTDTKCAIWGVGGVYGRFIKIGT
jgi:hypothetical protein